MKNNPRKNISRYLILLIVLSQIAACRSQAPLGVVSNYHWNSDSISTKHHKLTRHSKTISKITIHHTATQNKQSVSDIERLRGARRYHIEHRQWGDIAYHYLIAADGTIYQGRSSEFVGGSSNDYGLDSNLLIALMGNFEVENPSVQAIESLKKLITNRLIHYQIHPSNINTHREHTSTLCPGVKLQNWYNNKGKYEIFQLYTKGQW